MREFVRGQRSRLEAITSSPVLLVGVTIAARTETVFDISCFGVDENNALSDESYFIFYNQKSSPEGAIVALGPRDGDAEVFRVDLSGLPPAVRKLAFTVSIDGEGTMAEITRGHLRLLAEDGTEAARYHFTGADFGEEKALIVAEIYHKNVWRFAAVGQGFESDLRALLKHYGGEVAEESAPEPEVPPGPPVRVERGALQSSIDDAVPGATLSLRRDEYEGPILINKPLSVEGNGSVIWARRGPVLTVSASGVRLRNLDLEVTTLASNDEEGDIALKVAQGARCQLDEVSARGRVVGLGAEGDEWRLPLALVLGAFAPRKVNTFVFRARVPVACTLKSGVAGVSVEPVVLEPGEHEVTLTARDIGADTLVSGRLEVRSENLSRAISITGGTVGGTGMQPASRVRLFG